MTITILNYVREYYIAVFNVEKVEHLSNLMEIEFNKVGQITVDAMEMALYRQGISRFNLEDFNSSHNCFQRAISSLDEKIVEIEKHIAMMCAYEGASLAALGYDHDAIDCVERSISIREKLANCGNSKERANLWISHYNYAKVLLMLSDFERAEYECDTAIGIYSEEYPSNYIEKNSTNVSSLLQLKGRILAGQQRREEAISLLEEAKTIREKLKGKNYFSTAQVYSYLMSTYEQFNMIEEALNYAKLFYDVLNTQYKTDDILLKIKNVEAKIKQYERALCHA